MASFFVGSQIKCLLSPRPLSHNTYSLRTQFCLHMLNFGRYGQSHRVFSLFMSIFYAFFFCVLPVMNAIQHWFCVCIATDCFHSPYFTQYHLNAYPFCSLSVCQTSHLRIYSLVSVRLWLIFGQPKNLFESSTSRDNDHISNGQ